jgi:hypothetical protein
MSETRLRSAEWMRGFPLTGRLIGNGWFERSFFPAFMDASQLPQGFWSVHRRYFLPVQSVA